MGLKKSVLFLLLTIIYKYYIMNKYRSLKGDVSASTAMVGTYFA